MIEKRKFLLFIFIFLLLVGVYAHCRVGCKLVKSGINAYECRGGKIYKLTVDTRNWTLISLTPSNWSEVEEVVYAECPKYIEGISENSQEESK
ncbi:hypothetical protein DRN43_07350 [Thermococci archaeon]|nr:MAG: hypothetical protein DRN43_07350 [Thermococci archaeon]